MPRALQCVLTLTAVTLRLGGADEPPEARPKVARALQPLIDDLRRLGGWISPKVRLEYDGDGETPPASRAATSSARPCRTAWMRGVS